MIDMSDIYEITTLHYVAFKLRKQNRTKTKQTSKMTNIIQMQI